LTYLGRRSVLRRLRSDAAHFEGVSQEAAQASMATDPRSPTRRSNHVVARTFRMAAAALDDASVTDVSVFHVLLSDEDADNDNAPPPEGLARRQRRRQRRRLQRAAVPHESNGSDAFRAFVTSLHTNRTLGSINFFDHDFGRAPDGRVVTAREEEDVDRLFGHVLPNHRTLACVRMIEGCRLPPGAFGAYMGALSSRTSLRSVTMCGCPLAGRDVRALAAMLRRNVPVTSLHLQQWNRTGNRRRRGTGGDAGGRGGGRGSAAAPLLPGREHGGIATDHVVVDDDDTADDACRILCDGCAHNEHIKSLTLCDEFLVIDKGALEGAVGPAAAATTLAHLGLSGAWTVAGFADLMFQLRTNETLETCSANHAVTAAADDEDPAVPFALVEELLLTYNCTLRTLYTDSLSETAHVDRINHLLHCNQKVRKARDHLEKRNYAVGPVAAWPHALERVQRFPTLVYRFIRRGNLPVLSDHLHTYNARAKRPGRPHGHHSRTISKH
jgi:hypothetical protein